MTTTVGSSTSYPITIPALTDTADIQVALELAAYGTNFDPTGDVDIVANSIFGKISALNTSKAALASPTFTGTVTLPTGSSSASPLKFVAGTNLTTPAYGSIEAATDGIYVTNNPGSTSTGPGRGIVSAPQIVYQLGNSTATSTTTMNVFSSSNDVLSVLEPAKLYRFKGMYYFGTLYTSSTAAIRLLMTFSQSPVFIKYTFRTTNASVSTGLDYVGLSTSASATTVSSTITSSTNYAVEFEGFFTTHASLTSTFTPQFNLSTTGSQAYSTIGSWIQIEKLGTSSQSLIAGNWA